MPVSPARWKAFEILVRIERQAAYSSELLNSGPVDELSPADRALAVELVMGVLRWRSRLDATIAKYSFTPFHKLDLEVLTALRLGVYQLEFLARVPARAAINESVEVVKQARKASAAPLTNAVLRKVPKAANDERAARHGASFGVDAESHPSPQAGERVGHPAIERAGYQEAEEVPARLAAAFAHPAWLVERWGRHYGAAAAEAICRAGQTVPATALRLAPGADDAAWLDQGVELGRGQLLRGARRVVAGHPAAQALATQDEGSQLVALLVGRGERILDCCAAPGGKTAALAERNPKAEIIAVDVHPHRVRLMRELLGSTRVRLMEGDARDLPLGGGFDRVLADVPCSGTGTLARNPEIKWRLKPADLDDLAARQQAILKGALAQVAPGGRLVYSTCSLEPEENEAVVEAVMAEAAGFAIIDIADELARLGAAGELVWPDMASIISGRYLRTLPGIHPCDGFFAAVIRRYV